MASEAFVIFMLGETGEVSASALVLKEDTPTEIWNILLTYDDTNFANIKFKCETIGVKQWIIDTFNLPESKKHNPLCLYGPHIAFNCTKAPPLLLGIRSFWGFE